MTDMRQSEDEPVLPQEEFNREHLFKSTKSVLYLKAVTTELNWSWKSVLLSLFPILVWLPEYDCKTDFISDLLSGFTVAVMHVPQGMAYATLGNVNPIVGVYMAVFPTLPYVLMGTSKHISLGTFSVSCIMAARPVLQFSGQHNFTERLIHLDYVDYKFSPIEVASVLCVSVGIFQVLLGVIKAGYLSVFLSKPIISGFTTGAAVLVLISQLPLVFGIKTPGKHFGPLGAVYDVLDLVTRLPETNPIELITSVVVLSCLLICTECIEPWLKWRYKLPLELVILALGAWISFLFDFKKRYNIKVVGNIPTGIPGMELPRLELLTIPHFLLESISVAIVCYAVSLSMATTFAMKDNYKIDSNQELYANGFGNIFGGFFPCLPMAASLSRSAISYSTGGKTQLVTIFSSIFLIFTMLFTGKYLYPLPYSVLAGIVIKNLKNMLFQVTQFPTFWKQSYSDGVIWLLVFLSVIFIDIVSGLVIAFLLAVTSIILMNQKTYICLLGQVPESDLFLEMRRYEAAKPVDGMMLVQIYAGLHFANIHVCINRLEYLFKKTSRTENVKVVILVFSTVLFVDPEALEHLTVFINQLKKEGVEVCVTECSGRVFEQMTKCNFFAKFSGAILLFPSTQNAVAHYKKSMLLDEQLDLGLN